MDNRLLVLAVDDDEDTRESLAALLRFEGHEVVVAGDGREAVAVARCECPDVVLLDIHMPHLDGYEVGRHLKESQPEKPPFVIAVTAQPEDARRRGEAGIDLYLMKPVDPPRLASLLRRFGKVVEVAESVPQPPLTVPQMA